MSEAKEETYQDDLRYERAVWPEKFHSAGTKTVFDEYQAEKKDAAEWRERLLLALQGIDVSLEILAAKLPVEITTIGGTDRES